MSNLKLLGGVYALLLGVALCYYSPMAEALDDFDLYKYGDTKVNIERTSFILKLVLYPNQKELDKSYLKVTGKKKKDKEEFGGIRAFTNMSADNDVCTVHMIPPKIWDDRELLTIMGHEVLHCTLAEHQDADKEMAERKKEYENRNKPIIDEEEDLLREDTRLGLENLAYECSNNTEFDFIAGCEALDK